MAPASASWSAHLRAKVTDIEALEKRLVQGKAQLKAVIADIEAKPDDMNCADNARRVMSRVLDAETVALPASAQRRRTETKLPRRNVN